MKLINHFIKDKLAALSLFIIILTAVVGLFAPWLAPHHPEEVNMELRFASPSWEHLLGNDQLGRDVLSRLMYGIRPSVLWVFVALALSVGIGSIIGFIAGYFGGRTDAILMRVCDIMLSFPGYVMTFAIIGILGVGLENILIAFVAMKWAWFARIIRTSVMQYAEADYVRFSKILGVRNFKIMVKHIVPVSFPDIAVISSSAFSSMILQLSGFSFLGLGIQAPHPEWGMMLNEAREVMFTRPEMMLAPGITTIIFVATVNFFTDSLQIALNPKLMSSYKKKTGRRASFTSKLQRKEVA